MRARDRPEQYDHAYTLEGQRDRLDALAGALWRGIYSRNENMDEQVVKLMAEHVDSELDDVLELDAVSMRAKYEMWEIDEGYLV